MLFLWVFGDNVEDATGHAKFLFFYLACGVFAGLFHTWMLPDSDLPLIGASGAVAGVIAAYLMLHPRVGVGVLAFKFIPLRISAGLLLGIWIALQVAMVAVSDAGPTAWWAHIGGLLAGAALILVLRRPGVPLFDKGHQARLIRAAVLAGHLCPHPNRVNRCPQLTCLGGARTVRFALANTYYKRCDRGFSRGYGDDSSRCTTAQFRSA